MSRSPPMHRRPPVEGYRSPNDSLDRISRSRSEHSGMGSTGKWKEWVSEWERKRDRKTERGRETQKETQRKRKRVKERKRKRERDRERDRERQRKKERDTYRVRETETKRKTERDRHMQGGLKNPQEALKFSVLCIQCTCTVRVQCTIFHLWTCVQLFFLECCHGYIRICLWWCY